MSTELGSSENPRKWRFTWESQSHISTLKLYLFNPNTIPSAQCADLKVNLFLDQSLLKVSWFKAEHEVSLRVPIPRALVDFESPVQFKALDDHIEVKVALLLPIDHPIVSTLDSLSNLSVEDVKSCSRNVLSDELKPLVLDCDLDSLSSREGVYFYCRSCSTKLTTSLRIFEEMPSVNWREVADNWFGNCCCSFGGISEKLVSSYAKSYTSRTGVCFLNTTSVVLCKDDLVRCVIPGQDGTHKEERDLDFSSDNCLNKSNGSKHERTIVSYDSQSKRMHDSLSQVSQTFEDKNKVASPPGCLVDTNINLQDHDTKCCTHNAPEPSSTEQESKGLELQDNQKSFLNGFLGNVFMTRSSNLSKDVHWIKLLCPQCSCLLGAYPCGTDDAPFDSGLHLFKCCMSTCLDVESSNNLFRKYTLERMFSNLLLESAKDELSYRTAVRDLQTKRPMLQIVLLNPNSWCCAGYCSGTGEQVAKIEMYPSIKLLFSDCSNSNECQLRMIEEWTTKNQADEIYMLSSQIKELIGSLDLMKNILPPSHTLLQGFLLSSMRR